jgi:hypothetical protein
MPLKTDTCVCHPIIPVCADPSPAQVSPGKWYHLNPPASVRSQKFLSIPCISIFNASLLSSCSHASRMLCSTFSSLYMVSGCTQHCMLVSAAHATTSPRFHQLLALVTCLPPEDSSWLSWSRLGFVRLPVKTHLPYSRNAYISMSFGLVLHHITQLASFRSSSKHFSLSSVLRPSHHSLSILAVFPRLHKLVVTIWAVVRQSVAQNSWWTSVYLATHSYQLLTLYEDS